VKVTDKKPLIAVSPIPVEIWYEGPTLVVADKPPGMAVYPETPESRDTLVNALLQSNRWLANMERSQAPGVLHALHPADRGLVAVAKTEDAFATVQDLLAQGRLTFSYRVTLPNTLRVDDTAAVTIVDQVTYGDTRVVDLDTPVGDTRTLRQTWLRGTTEDVYFVLYRLAIPVEEGVLEIALGDRTPLPQIDLYTAPP
jgi:23S rRNA-/tRNA-specific pseudouridylate synthase